MKTKSMLREMCKNQTIANKKVQMLSVTSDSENMNPDQYGKCFSQHTRSGIDSGMCGIMMAQKAYQRASVIYYRRKAAV